MSDDMEIDIDFGMDAEMPLLLAFVDEEGDLNVQIDTDQLGSPENAGIILAALEDHLAGALAHAGLATSEETAMVALRAAYQSERAAPTNDTTGGMLGEET